MLLLGLGLASTATADTIWLNAKGAAQRQQIETDLAPAKCFVQPPPPNRPPPPAGQPAPPPQLFLRGRVLGATIQGGGAPTLVNFEAWWRDPATAIPPGQDGPNGQWSRQPMDIPWDWILRIEHESDGDVDLRMLLSSRDQLKGETSPSAHFRTALWNQRMRPAIDPTGQLKLLDPRGTSAPVDVQQVEIVGWVLSHLAGGAAVPTTPEEHEAHQAQVQAELAAMQQSGVDPFSPLLCSGTPDDAIRDLVTGAARSKRYDWLHRRQDWDPVANRPLNQRLYFEKKALFVGALLCSLSKVDPARFRGTPLQPTAQRYHQFGTDARSALIRIIEAGAPGVLSPDDPPAVVDAWLRHQSAALTDPAAQAAAQAELQAISQAARRGAQPAVRAAQLPVDPGEMAYEALLMIDEYETFQFRRPTAEDDGERIIRALVALGRPVEGPDPRRGDNRRNALPDRAREVLVKLLRPDLGDPRRDEGELDRLRDSARRYREDLAPLFTDADAPTREFILEALTHAGHVEPIAASKAVDGLFGAALGDDPNAGEGATTNAEEDQARVRRARREYAITTLVILGNLADPRERSYTPDERAIGTDVLRRVETMRDAVDEKRGTRSQRSFLETIDGLEENERVDEGMRNRVMRFRRHGRDIGRRDSERALGVARGNLQRAINEGKGPEVIDPLRAEVERLRTRMQRFSTGQ